MIDKESNPVEWSTLVYELEDAREHLSKLISDLEIEPVFGDEEFRIQLAHVFSHLNRAWRRREMSRDFSDSEWEEASQYHHDLKPM